MDELADFVLNYRREGGAIVEPPAYGVYEVLLPDELAARLGVSGYQRFAFGDTLTTEAGGAGEVTHVSSERYANRKPTDSQVWAGEKG